MSSKRKDERFDEIGTTNTRKDHQEKNIHIDSRQGLNSLLFPMWQMDLSSLGNREP